MDNRYFNEYFSVGLNLICASAILFISLAVETGFFMPDEITRPLGIFVIFAGLFLSAWAMLYIKRGIFGIVKPRLNILIKDGPYRFIRHPFYLGAAISLAGVTVLFRNWLGLTGVFILFIPCEIYRAHFEDKALFDKFGIDWKEYAKNTGFIFPLLGRTKKPV